MEAANARALRSNYAKYAEGEKTGPSTLTKECQICHHTTPPPPPLTPLSACQCTNMRACSIAGVVVAEIRAAVRRNH